LTAAPEHESPGHVGIFWINQTQVLADTVVWTGGESYGDFVNGLSDHCTHWATFQQQRPELRRYEYEQVPRGRVIYNTLTATFTVYGSERFIRDEAQRAIVLAAFHLPRNQTRFVADEHYGPVPGMLRD
jgi:hypothetical protein